MENSLKIKKLKWEYKIKEKFIYTRNGQVFSYFLLITGLLSWLYVIVFLQVYLSALSVVFVYYGIFNLYKRFDYLKKYGTPTVYSITKKGLNIRYTDQTFDIPWDDVLYYRKYGPIYTVFEKTIAFTKIPEFIYRLKAKVSPFPKWYEVKTKDYGILVLRSGESLYTSIEALLNKYSISEEKFLEQKKQEPITALGKAI